MIRQALLTAALFALPLAATAQEPANCTLSPDHWVAEVAPMLDGFWQVNSRVGTLEMAGRVIPLPPGPASTAGITHQADGALTISSDMIGGDYPLDWADPGQRWNFTPGPEVPVNAADFPDDEDLALLTGCEDANTLPRLRATGSFTETEGRVEFDLLLFVVDANALYGVTIGRLNGGQGTARRILTFTR
ncbi:hypothetical protein E7811_12400 [Aliigemmobacter aestuarii]|uniref:Lipocalin-like domain-containing protein n=1 Tax=Aliigemmobacter aestuarii TaxID=1445661 RepID=A0A4S3MN45_9RHOB|nr:hypothetical protein [Gemmobacter aestuarii]THD82943.1 hypothetical protein E7811_12400 [Gemmobacter aestuarii]